MLKKIFFLLVAMTCSMAAMATDYDGQLDMAVGDTTYSMGASMTVTQDGDSTYTLKVKNLKVDLLDKGISIPLGTLEMKNCVGTEAFGLTNINYDGNVTLYLPLPTSVPVKMKARFNGQVLSVALTVTMKTFVTVVDMKFIGSAPLPEKGDVNADGVVNTADVSSVVDTIMVNE